jgi:hypothetical protein
MAGNGNDIAAVLRGHAAALRNLQAQQAQIIAALNAQQSRPRTIQEEIDAIEGRRIEGVLSGEITFTAADVGNRAAPIIFQVSQDGPFIMTHYPMALWRPTLPSNATNISRWRPVTTYPLPDQVVDTDIIDILYELNDGGSQRLGQNAPRGPLLSRPDNIVPCPIPTVWSPNAAIQFQPTYLHLAWDSQVPPTQGTLHVDLIGYRIANL